MSDELVASADAAPAAGIMFAAGWAFRDEAGELIAILVRDAHRGEHVRRDQFAFVAGRENDLAALEAAIERDGGFRLPAQDAASA